MKFILTLFVLIAILSTMDAEPSLGGEYKATPFERCVEAYSGSDNIKQCEEYK
jgi:hypothetical protein